MRRSRGRRIVGWTAVGASVLLLLVYAANVPFYAGSSIGLRNDWRMEHGRLTWSRYPARNIAQGFWVNGNSEGLRFGWAFQRSGPGDWRITVPLWAPLLVSAGVAVWAFRSGRPRRRDRGSCGACGYDVGGLHDGKCPECGANTMGGSGG